MLFPIPSAGGSKTFSVPINGRYRRLVALGHMQAIVLFSLYCQHSPEYVSFSQGLFHVLSFGSLLSSNRLSLPINPVERNQNRKEHVEDLVKLCQVRKSLGHYYEIRGHEREAVVCL